jgi:hypothetical protein
MRTAERGGDFWHYRKGIALGCALSPLIGAFFLAELDWELERNGFFFVRYMEDIAILATTRRQIRRAVKLVNQVLARLGLEKHPEKTFVGRIDKGFGFLGYHVRRGELRIAEKTLENYRERASRLYEQEPGEPLRSSRLGLYARRFARWARAGLGDIPLRGPLDDLNGLPT